MARTSLLPRHGLSPCTCTLLRNISCRFWKVVSTPPETTAGHESRSPGFADAARTFDQVADADGAAARLLAELADAKSPDLAMLSVALRKLRNLA